MPQKHFYFSLGAVLGVLLVNIVGRYRHQWRKTSHFIQKLYRTDKHWFLYFPVVIFICGLWGLVPDALHGLGILPKDLTRSAGFDVFLLHSTFERIEDSMPVLNHFLNWLGELILLVIALAVMVFYVKQAKRAVTARRTSHDLAGRQKTDGKTHSNSKIRSSSCERKQ